MIQAKDLKLMRGNYVLVTFDETETGFGKDYIGKVDAIQRTKIMVEGDLHWHPIDKIKPVELSPDILEGCGFEETPLQPYIDKPAFIYRAELTNIIWSEGHVFVIVSNGNYKKIGEAEYLHNLQNAWPFLTGEELTITL